MEVKSEILNQIYEVIEERGVNPKKNSYVSLLLKSGTEKVLNKIVEKTGELIAGVLNKDRREIIHKMADLWFHTLVLLGSLGVSPDDIFEELEKRWKSQE